jgi:hypothetical protein
MIATLYKAPIEVLDYGVAWSEWLAGDTIATSTWAVPVGLTLESQSHGSSGTTAWISGGTAGILYEIDNRITTALGRTATRTFRIACIAARYLRQENAT